MLFWYSSQVQGEFYRIVEFFKELVAQDERSAMAVFVLIAALAALISPLTNIPLVPFAVAIWGAFPTAVLLLFGWILGDIFAYVVGRYLGRAVVSYIFSSEKVEEWSSLVKKHSTLARAFFVRLVFPAELGYAFGIIRYDFSYYVAITFLAELPFAVVSAYASEAVLAGNVVRFLGLTVLLLVAVYGGLRVLRTNHSH